MEFKKEKRTLNNIQDILLHLKRPEQGKAKFRTGNQNITKSVPTVKAVTNVNDAGNGTGTSANAGKERPNHKYIKREKDDETGKWKYFYKDDTGKLSSDIKDDDKTELSKENRFNRKRETPKNDITDEKTQKNEEQSYKRNSNYLDNNESSGIDTSNNKKSASNPMKNEEIQGEESIPKKETILEELKDKVKEKEAIENKKLADNYVRIAGGQKNWFLDDMDNIARKHNITGDNLPSYKFGEFAVKSESSILNKIERNNANGKSHKNSSMTDILRSTMIINSENDAEGIVNDLKDKGYNIDEYENLYLDKTAGYKHIAIKLTKGKNDPLVKELLLMRPEMLKAKFGLGHDLYDIDKNIIIAIPKLETLNQDLKSAVNTFRNSLIRISQSFYTKAYELDKLGSEDSASADLKSDINFDAPSPTTDNKNSVKAVSSSKVSPKDFIFEIKSAFIESLHPALAKVRNSVSDNPNSGAYLEAIALIRSSIIDPYEKMVNKYSKSFYNSLFNILKKGNIIKGKLLKSHGLKDIKKKSWGMTASQ